MAPEHWHWSYTRLQCIWMHRTPETYFCTPWCAKGRKHSKTWLAPLISFSFSTAHHPGLSQLHHPHGGRAVYTGFKGRGLRVDAHDGLSTIVVSVANDASSGSPVEMERPALAASSAHGLRGLARGVAPGVHSEVAVGVSIELPARQNWASFGAAWACA